jgi:cytochrome c peroxidase
MFLVHCARATRVPPLLAPVGLASLLLALGGCGGDAGTPAAPSAPNPTPGAAAFPGISAALTINPLAFDEYANPAIPPHLRNLTRFDNTPASNPVTNAGATLGRVLFFDKQLSLTGTASCASCHIAQAGFGDTVRFSTGFAGRQNTSAQSMRLLNLKFFKPGTAFWDRRASSLEALATAPIRDSIELGFTDAVGGLDSLLRRMRTLPYYPELFTLAFGDDGITEERLRRALAQYLRSIVSRDSRFDRSLAVVGGTDFAVPFPDFTPEENRGKFLFMTIRPNGGLQCFECHAGPTLSLTLDVRSNGVDSTERRIFRAPSLKNVATSKHFMHDGRFSSLEEVVEFYNSGVQPSPLIDERMIDTLRRPRRLHLSASDKAALVAFLGTLTDIATPFERRFSDPFRP